MNKVLTLIYEFFKTGLFAVGGGLATIPFLFDISQKYQWFSETELSMMIAISESTPGPMGINMATYAGYNTLSFVGAIIATLSLVTPSVIVICIIANYLKRFKESKIVKMIFSGIRPSVIAFIIGACLSLFISTLFITNNNYIEAINIKSILLFIFLIYISRLRKDIHPIFIIIMSALVGIVFGF